MVCGCSFVPEPTEEDLAAQAAEATGDVAAIAAPPAAAEVTAVEELSGDSDGFEDLGKDTDAIQLRQRRAAASANAAGGVDAAAAADAAPTADATSKKGQ